MPRRRSRRRLNQRILELQSRLDEDATEAAAGEPAPAASRLYSLEQELQNKTMQIGEMEIRLAEQGERQRRGALVRCFVCKR